MSEYTKYFAVKSSSSKEVRGKLNQSKILSIVDDDSDDYFFEKKYKRNGLIAWVAVTAPPVSGSDTFGNYFQTDQFENFEKLFEEYVLFFQEEDAVDWILKVKSGDNVIEKSFEEAHKTEFSDKDKGVFSKCFERPFGEMEKLLIAGKAADFLNFVGIPYLEMNDQDKCWLEASGEKYSFYAEEID